MASTALVSVARWIVQKYFEGYLEVPKTASEQLKPSLASTYRDLQDAPIIAPASFQIQVMPGDESAFQVTGAAFSAFVLAWMLFCLAIGVCFSSLAAKEAAQSVKDLFYRQVLPPSHAMIANLQLASRQKDDRIKELIGQTDSLLEEANKAKAKAQRYETLLFEWKLKAERNLALGSFITIPASIVYGNIEDGSDIAFPCDIVDDIIANDTTANDTPANDTTQGTANVSGDNDTTNGNAQEEPKDLQAQVDDKPEQPETVEDAAPKKRRNKRRRQNQRARRPEGDGDEQ
ncbi:MAG: hypothetical protein Q9191_005566 [Dirinaria sp. TL-2023a]